MQRQAIPHDDRCCVDRKLTGASRFHYLCSHSHSSGHSAVVAEESGTARRTGQDGCVSIFAHTMVLAGYPATVARGCASVFTRVPAGCAAVRGGWLRLCPLLCTARLRMLAEQVSRRGATHKLSAAAGVSKQHHQYLTSTVQGMHIGGSVVGPARSSRCAVVLELWCCLARALRTECVQDRNVGKGRYGMRW